MPAEPLASPSLSAFPKSQSLQLQKPRARCIPYQPMSLLRAGNAMQERPGWLHGPCRSYKPTLPFLQRYLLRGKCSTWQTQCFPRHGLSPPSVPPHPLGPLKMIKGPVWPTVSWHFCTENLRSWVLGRHVYSVNIYWTYKHTTEWKDNSWKWSSTKWEPLVYVCVCIYMCYRDIIT